MSLNIYSTSIITYVGSFNIKYDYWQIYIIQTTISSLNQEEETSYEMKIVGPSQKKRSKYLIYKTHTTEITKNLYEKFNIISEDTISLNDIDDELLYGTYTKIIHHEFNTNSIREKLDN